MKFRKKCFDSVTLPYIQTSDSSTFEHRSSTCQTLGRKHKHGSWCEHVVYASRFGRDGSTPKYYYAEALQERLSVAYHIHDCVEQRDMWIGSTTLSRFWGAHYELCLSHAFIRSVCSHSGLLKTLQSLAKILSRDVAVAVRVYPSLSCGRNSNTCYANCI